MARTLISDVLDGAGALGFLLRLRARTAAPWLTVLTYHRVANPLVAADVDQEVVDARPEDFEQQLTFLKKYCNVIDLEDLRAFQRGYKLPPNPVLITFDDGYRDNYETAFPILKSHGMTAVFFIATAFIQERRLFWWDRLNYLVKRSKREVLELTYPTKLSVVLGQGAERRAEAVRQLLPVVKSHYAIELDRFLDGIEAASGVALTGAIEKKLAEEHLMTWKDVRELSDGGMSVQSHTRTHRPLQQLTARDLLDELGGSREELAAVLGRDVDAIAYPVGRSLLSAPHARTAIRRAGYKLGFSNGTGLNNIWKFDAMEVRRLCLERDCTPSYFRAMVAVPHFAYSA
jgi:peptidoglycan/xylan/chitin deacetylase (PgdA/CDA1 family)